MSKSDSGQYVRIEQGAAHPSGSGFGYLLVGLMALALAGLDAYGFQQATGLPPLIGISLAGLICIVRFFLIRRRPSRERLASSNLERAGACVPASFLAVSLTAFAIYSFSVSGTEVPHRTSDQTELAVAAIEDYYHELRTKLNMRNRQIILRLSHLNSEPPSSATEEVNEEIKRLNQEQQDLDPLREHVVNGLRPNDPSLLGEEGSQGERKTADAEAALRGRFDRAAKLHGKLPEYIRNKVELPKLENLPVERIRGGKFERFLRDTLSVTRPAIGCWVFPAILELFIILLVLVNRSRD